MFDDYCGSSCGLTLRKQVAHHRNSSLQERRMAENSLISILHLSDFHFSKRKSKEQNIIVDALAKDLRTLCIGDMTP